MYYIRILLEVIIFMYWWSFWIGTGRSRHSFVFSKWCFFEAFTGVFVLLCLCTDDWELSVLMYYKSSNFPWHIFAELLVDNSVCVRYIQISFFKFILWLHSKGLSNGLHNNVTASAGTNQKLYQYWCVLYLVLTTDSYQY